MSGQAAPRWPQWLCALVLIGSGMLAYANSLSGPFLIDDAVTIVDNPHVRQLWPLSYALFSESETPAAGRPLVNLSFAINYALGGLAVRGYHLVNIAIHLLCALLLFGLIRRTLELPSCRAHFTGTSTGVALAAAMLWMLHPLNTESVDYITQRTELMMGFFLFLTLYANSCVDEVPGQGWPWRTIAVGACAAGMACKETMVTAPVLVVLYDWVFRDRSRLKTTLRARGWYYGALASTLGLVVALEWSGPRARSTGWSVGISVWNNLLNQSVMIARYLRLTFWPTALVLNYGYTHTVDLVDVLPSALLIVGLLAGTVVLLLRGPRLGFLAAWFFITLAPTSSLVPMITEVGAERRMYLPLVAPVMLAVLALHALARKISRSPGASSRSPGYAAAIVVVAGLAAACTAGTRARNREYRSGLAMAETVLERWPTGYAHMLIATELIAVGDHQAAVPHLRVAVRDTPRAEYALGVELARQGQKEEALEHLEAFVRLQPLLAEAVNARNLIGRIFLDSKRLDEAAAQFRLVLQMDPSFEAAHGQLGDVLLAQQQWPAAIEEYQRYLPRHDDDANAWVNLGVAFEQAGQNGNAIAAFRHALAVDPLNPVAARDAAIERLSEGDYAGATSYARQAVARRPDDPVAHDLLGLGLAFQSQFSEAVIELRRAVALAPSNTDFQQHLADAQRSLAARGESPASHRER